MNKRKVFRWAKVLILLYCIPALLLYYLQDRLVMHPEKVEAGFKYDFATPYTEIFINYDRNTAISMVQFRPADTGAVKGVVLYFHGNKRNISRYQQYAPWFTRNGYEVWMIDYPGFGKSTGSFSESIVNDLAVMKYTLARKRFSPDSIVIYGKSLGTGIAAYLASVRNCRYLILESPYYSFPSVISRYAPIYPVARIMKYRFPTYQYLPQVTDPVILIHGTNDWVIPYSQAERLRPLLKRTDRLIPVEGGGHNDLFEYSRVPQVLDSLLQGGP